MAAYGLGEEPELQDRVAPLVEEPNGDDAARAAAERGASTGIHPQP